MLSNFRTPGRSVWHTRTWAGYILSGAVHTPALVEDEAYRSSGLALVYALLVQDEAYLKKREPIKNWRLYQLRQQLI